MDPRPRRPSSSARSAGRGRGPTRSPSRSRSLTSRLLPFAAACLAFAILLVASPARAAAPLCDHRGAITFAPAPVLQAPMTSIDVGDDGACAATASPDPALHRGRSPQPLSSSVVEPAILAEAVVPTPPPGSSLLVATPPDAPDASGVRGRVDRPPRA